MEEPAIKIKKEPIEDNETFKIDINIKIKTEPIEKDTDCEPFDFQINKIKEEPIDLLFNVPSVSHISNDTISTQFFNGSHHGKGYSNTTFTEEMHTDNSLSHKVSCLVPKRKGRPLKYVLTASQAKAAEVSSLTVKKPAVTYARRKKMKSMDQDIYSNFQADESTSSTSFKNFDQKPPKSPDIFEEHINLNEDELDFMCNRCGCKFKPKDSSQILQITAHLKMIHSNTKIHQYIYCDKCVFSIEEANNSTEFHCQFCTYHCKFKSTFDRHLITHSQAKGYFCSICQKSFKLFDSLRIHKKTFHSSNHQQM